MYTNESDTFRKRNRQLVVWREGVAYQDLDQISVRYLQGLYPSRGGGGLGGGTGQRNFDGLTLCRRRVPSALRTAHCSTQENNNTNIKNTMIQ